jgi:hypothetical protein
MAAVKFTASELTVNRNKSEGLMRDHYTLLFAYNSLLEVGDDTSVAHDTNAMVTFVENLPFTEGMFSRPTFEFCMLCSTAQQPLYTLTWKHQSLFRIRTSIITGSSFLSSFFLFSFILCLSP